MFEALTSKLTTIFAQLGRRGALTEQDVDEALREIRLALLEADVNFRVAQELIKRVRERAVGVDVLRSLSPGQQVIKVVNDELTATLGGGNQSLKAASQPPSVLLLAGLQGSGKTTTAAKLALHLRQHGQRPLLVACDLRRPAAIEQLESLGKQLDIPVYQETTASTPVQIAENGVRKGQQINATWVIIDSSGRLHVDDELMQELEDLKRSVNPSEILMVLDSMTGQDAVQAAQEFHQRINVTGLILTKLDGDARGGAALSVTQVTGAPIKFIGTGEKSDALEAFHPDRMASRILGMGDMLSLIEKAQENYAQKETQELEQKIRQSTFDLEDFQNQIQQVKKMGSLSSIMDMIPGLSQMNRRMVPEALDDKQFTKIEALIASMTPHERQNPEIINGSRRRRIAFGSGTTPQDVNQLINQFRQTQKMMKQLSSTKGKRNFARLFRPH